MFRIVFSLRLREERVEEITGVTPSLSHIKVCLQAGGGLTECVKQLYEAFCCSMRNQGNQLNAAGDVTRVGLETLLVCA